MCPFNKEVAQHSVLYKNSLYEMTMTTLSINGDQNYNISLDKIYLVQLVHQYKILQLMIQSASTMIGSD